MLPFVLLILFFITSYLVGRAIVKLTKIYPDPLLFVTSLLFGIITVTIILFLSGFILPFNQLTITGIFIILFAIAAWFLENPILVFRADLKELQKPTAGDLFISIFLVGLLIWLFGRALFFTPNGTLVAGDRLVWTDWPVHLAMAANFAWGKNFPPQNPTFAGTPLIYPFFADFLSGAFLSLNIPIPWAFGVPAVVLIILFCILYLILGKSLFIPLMGIKAKRNAIFLAFGALFMSLFWGGIGWLYWLQEAFSNQTTLIETVFNPPREYTFWGEKGLWFFTFLYSEILPQRSFIFGLPIFFLVLWLIKSGWDKRVKSHFVLAGILAGILPFFHTHTYLSLVFFAVTLFVLAAPFALRGSKELKRRYLETVFLFFLPLGLISFFQLPLFLSGHHELPFVFGWMKEKENFFQFWFKNTGLFIPLALFGLWKGKFAKNIKLAGMSSWILFILPNLFRFAPWGYDNLKIFTFWYLLNAFFAAWGLYLIWQKRKIIGPFVASLLFISLTLSGIIEVGRIVDTSKVQLNLWSKADQEFAQEIRNKTDPQAVFLTAAIHDDPIATLAGRKIVIGYPGNSWSWGIDGWSQRETDVHTMFKGGQGALDLWQKYGIDYIVVSDRERYFEPRLDERFISKNTTAFFENGTTRVYKVKK